MIFSTFNYAKNLKLFILNFIRGIDLRNGDFTLPEILLENKHLNMFPDHGRI